MIVIDYFQSFIGNSIINSVLEKSKKINKKRALTNIERLKLSIIQHWIGNTLSSMKLLKADIEELEDLQALSVEKKLEFIRETHMLNFLGAYSIASKRFRYLEKEIFSGEMVNIYPQFYNSLGNHYLQTFRFDQALQYFKNAQEILDEHTSAWFFNIISQADCLVGMKKYESAIDKMKDLSDFSQTSKMYEAIYEQVLGEYKVKKGEHTEAFVHLLTSEKIFKQLKLKNKDYAYCMLYLGVLYGVENKKDLALKYLLNAKKILSSSGQSILPLLELSYVYEAFGFSDMKMNLLFHLYPISYTNGNNWLNLKVASDKKTYFLFKKNQLIPLDNRYEEDIKDNNIINLMTMEVDVAGEKFQLSSLQMRLVYFLVITSPFGCFEALLLDYLYPESIYNEKERDKVKKMIQRLCKKGLHIKQSEKTYRFLNINDFTIYLQKL